MTAAPLRESSEDSRKRIKFALTNADMRIGGCGFNDNTWTVANIASVRSAVSNTALPTDTGCIEPGRLSCFEIADGM